jgi:hypothetical protein
VVFEVGYEMSVVDFVELIKASAFLVQTVCSIFDVLGSAD